MKVDVVFHIDANDEQRLEMALGNITNLLKEVSEDKASIALLANGPSVLCLTAAASEKWGKRVSELYNKGVRFYVCNNSLTKFELNIDGMLAECEVVKAGVLTLIELQNSGYAYIKP